MNNPNYFNSKGIILKIQPYSENDLIVKILTADYGVISLIARHARKSKRRFSNPPDLFERGNFRFRRGHGNLFTLEDFSPHGAFKELRNSLAKVAAASVLCECFEQLVKEEAEEPKPLFELLERALEGIEYAEKTAHTLTVCCSTLSKLLALSGFRPAETMPHSNHQSLMKLLNAVESITERTLKSRDAICDVALESTA